MKVEYGHYGICELSIDGSQIVLKDDEGVVYSSFRSKDFDSKAIEITARAIAALVKVGSWFPIGTGSALNMALAYAGYGVDGQWMPEGEELESLLEEGIIEKKTFSDPQPLTHAQRLLTMEQEADGLFQGITQARYEGPEAVEIYDKVASYTELFHYRNNPAGDGFDIILNLAVVEDSAYLLKEEGDDIKLMVFGSHDGSAIPEAEGLFWKLSNALSLDHGKIASLVRV